MREGEDVLEQIGQALPEEFRIFLVAAVILRQDDEILPVENENTQEMDDLRLARGFFNFALILGSELRLHVGKQFETVRILQNADEKI